MPSVLVTGANGFIGFSTVAAFLERGYNVVGTVRSRAKITYISNTFHNDRLQFAVVPDIAAPGAFDRVIKDHKFDAVLHTSSPVVFDIKDVEKEVYQPAINGTIGILKSIKQHGPTVKRVVVLSSFAAVVDHRKNPRPGYFYTGADWNPITREEGLLNANDGYYASKTLAEHAAWDFVKTEKPHFSLTTLCPPFVFGPPGQEVTSLDQLNASSAIMYDLFNGTGKIGQSEFIYVDVRDVALAHVLASEKDAAASQRYLIAEGRYSSQQFADYIWEHYPERAAAKGVDRGVPGQLVDQAYTYTAEISKSRKDLGLEYRSMDAMLADTFKRFEELELEGK